MKWILQLILITTYIAGITACKNTGSTHDTTDTLKYSDTTHSVTKDLNKAGSDAVIETQEEWNNFKSVSDKMIDDNDKAIVRLENKLDKAKIKVKDDYRRKIADLKEENAKLKRRMAEYKERKKEKVKQDWSSFKYNTNRDINKIADSIKSISDRIFE